MKLFDLFEKIETIASATEKSGFINRKKANKMVDPRGFFHPKPPVLEDEIISPEEGENYDFKKSEAIIKKVKSYVFFAFKKCQIDIDIEEFYYDVDENLVSVTLEDSELSSSKFNMLQKSGLSDNYVISSTAKVTLQIEFLFNKSLF